MHTVEYGNSLLIRFTDEAKRYSFSLSNSNSPVGLANANIKIAYSKITGSTCQLIDIPAYSQIYLIQYHYYQIYGKPITSNSRPNRS
jgi:hypothetical protein